MSKKESEFDRYERMKKLEREADAEKRKSLGGDKKKSGRPRADMNEQKKCKKYVLAYEEDEYVY